MTAPARHIVLLTDDERAQLAVAGSLCLPAARFLPGDVRGAGDAERYRCAQLVVSWLVEKTGATDEQALTHPMVTAILRPAAPDHYAPQTYERSLRTPEERRPASVRDSHYDRDGYCDNPARGY